MSDDIEKADAVQVADPESATATATEATTEAVEPAGSDSSKCDTPPPETVPTESTPSESTPPNTTVPVAVPAPLAAAVRPASCPEPADKENQHLPTFKKPMDKKPQPSAEKLEEAKFSAKYGKMKPGGSDFLRKKLNKGVKYFDSGDYNMEKQSGKLKLRPNSAKPPGLAGPGLMLGKQQQQFQQQQQLPPQKQLQQQPLPPPAGPLSLAGATGKTIPTPSSIPHRKQSTEISKLAV